jgi:uncharacterized membrane protein
MTTETRLAQVESELADVTTRLRRLEGEMEAPPPRRPEPPPPEGWLRAQMGPDALRHPMPKPPEPRPRTTATIDYEAIFGGQVLAWIGGLAILFAAVLFLGMAISRGWLNEETRTIIAATISLIALGGGFWLHERRGRTEAARALVAGAISGLFGTMVVATQTYSLIPSGLGLACGAAVAAVGFAIAVRWKSQVVAAVGSLGAVATPLLAGVDPSGLSIAFVAAALAATVGILVWQRWDWLALGAFFVSLVELSRWVNYDYHQHVALEIAVLAGFWLLYATAAIGYELRRRKADALPVSSWMLLLLSSFTFAGPGYGILHVTGHQTAAVVLLFGFAAVQVALGIAAIRLRIHREIGSLMIGLGIALTAVGLGAALHGPALVCGWAAAAVALAGLGSRLDATPRPGLSSAERMLIAAGGFLALAVGHTLIVEAPPASLFDGVESLTDAAIAIAACTAAAFSCAWFGRRVSPEGAEVAAFAGAAGLVYLASVAIVDTVGVYSYGVTRQAGQAWLSAFWTVTAIGAIIVGLLRREPALRLGGLTLLAVAIGKVWVYDLSELDQLARVLSFVGLGLLLLVGAFAYQRIKPEDRRRATRE